MLDFPRLLASASVEKIINQYEKVLGFVGMGVLAWMILRLGPHQVAENIHSVRWGFFAMVLMHGLYYFCQALSWKLILVRNHKRVKFWKLFKVNLEGEALNYITVTRMGGEPQKILAIRDNVGLAAAAASVILLKFCVILGFWLMISGGYIALLLYSDVTGEIKMKMALGLGFFTLLIFIFPWLSRFGFFKPVSWVLNQFKAKRSWITDQAAKLTRLDKHFLQTYHSQQGEVLFSTLLNVIAWLEEIVFVWIVFHFLNIHENWLLPTLIATTSLLLNSLFFFVPWRAGTQEGTMVLTFTILGLSEPLGLSFAILRRIRELIWVFAGLILFALETIPTAVEGKAIVAGENPDDKDMYED